MAIRRRPFSYNTGNFMACRTQVLRIVYLGGADKGGFYPDGLNGDIKAVSSDS